jgi:hypothetical protein
VSRPDEMRSAEMKRLTLELSADVRAGRYEADMDLGKSEYFGEAQELATAYEARARPILEAYLARGLITDEELAAQSTLGIDHDVLANQLQALAETLLLD